MWDGVPKQAIPSNANQYKLPYLHITKHTLWAGSIQCTSRRALYVFNLPKHLRIARSKTLKCNILFSFSLVFPSIEIQFKAWYVLFAHICCIERDQKLTLTYRSHESGLKENVREWSCTMMRPSILQDIGRTNSKYTATIPNILSGQQRQMFTFF